MTLTTGVRRAVACPDVFTQHHKQRRLRLRYLFAALLRHFAGVDAAGCSSREVIRLPLCLSVCLTVCLSTCLPTTMMMHQDVAPGNLYGNRVRPLG